MRAVFSGALKLTYLCAAAGESELLSRTAWAVPTPVFRICPNLR